MPTLRASDGGLLGYRDFGAGDDVVVLVHGWMVSGRVWDFLLPHVERGRRLIVPDLRGAGASREAPPDLTLERLGRDVAEIVEHAGPRRVHVVGHSMGGQVALVAAARIGARLRSLALLTPVPPDGLLLPPEVAASFRASGGSRDAQGGILDAACKSLSAEARGALLDDALRIAPEVIAAGFDAWTRGGVGERLAEIANPTMVLATDDPFLPPALLEEAVVRRVRGARLQLLRGPGHYPQVEAPAETGSLLDRFWSSVAP